MELDKFDDSGYLGSKGTSRSKFMRHPKNIPLSLVGTFTEDELTGKLSWSDDVVAHVKQFYAR